MYSVLTCFLENVTENNMEINWQSVRLHTVAAEVDIGLVEQFVWWTSNTCNYRSHVTQDSNEK